MASGDDLARATALLAERREGIVDGGLACRVAAYTSLEPGGDAARLATEHDADLVLVDAHPDAGTGALERRADGRSSQARRATSGSSSVARCPSRGRW